MCGARPRTMRARKQSARVLLKYMASLAGEIPPKLCVMYEGLADDDDDVEWWWKRARVVTRCSAPV